MNDKFIDALRKGNLEGRTRIILEDVRTRKREIHEDKNMITSAIQKIFEVNVMGLMNFHQLIPVRNLLGGVFLFWDPLTESADNIFAPCQADNKLTGHAGQTTHQTDSTTRGNPNGSASYIDAANGQVKFAWDFSLEQGNGQISAVSLTNPGAGDCGLYPDGTLPLMKTYGILTRGLNQFSGAEQGGYTYNETISFRFPMSLNADGTGNTVFLDGTSFKENVIRHGWVRPSLIEPVVFNAADNYTVVSTRSATLSRSFNREYTSIGQDSANYYIMERDASTSTRLYLEIVSKSDFSVTSQTIDISGATLARQQGRKNQCNNGIVSNGFIYWVSGSDAKTFVRIDIQTPANTDVLTSSLTGNISMAAQPISGSNGLILGYNYLINGDFVYPVARRDWRSGDNYATIDSMSLYKNSPMVNQMSSTYDDAGYNIFSVGPCLYLPYLASVNNLSQPITKTINRTMRVEYLLTLTGGN